MRKVVELMGNGLLPIIFYYKYLDMDYGNSQEFTYHFATV